MPKVPTYDALQVSQNSLPTQGIRTIETPILEGVKPPITSLLTDVPMMQAPRQMPDIVGRTMQHQGEQMASTGRQMADIGVDIQHQFNVTRVTDGLTNAVKAGTLLESDPNTGYRRALGQDAVIRKSGQSLADEYTGQYEKQLQQISDGLANDAQKRMFNERAGGMLAQFQAGVMNHQATQTNHWNQSVQIGMIDAQKNAISANPDDPTNGDRIQAIRDSAMRLAELQGKSVNEAQSVALKEVSNANRVAILSTLNPGTADALTKANGFFEAAKKAGNLTGDDVLYLDDRIRRVREGYFIQSAVDGVTTQLMGRNITPNSPDALQRAIGTQESGQNQWRPDGSPITSSKGAIGQFQLMPATAKRMAEMPGGPGWDPSLFNAKRTGDPQKDQAAAAYNQQLSSMYIGVLSRMFVNPNDPDSYAKVIAAYNAGEGNVQKAVAKAEKNGGDWRDYLPEETKKYLPIVQANLAKINGGTKVSNTDIDSTLDGIPGLTPEQKSQIRSGVASNITRANQDAAANQNQLMSGAYDKILQNGGNFNALTQDDLAGIPSQKLDDLRSYANKIRSGNDQTDPESWIQFKMLDQNQLAKLDVVQFKADFQDKLSTKDLGTAIDKIQAAQGKGDLRNKALITKDEMVKDSAYLNGIMLHSTSGMSESAKSEMGHRFIEFSQAVDSRITQELDANPQAKLDRAFYQKAIDDVLRQQVLRPTFMSRNSFGYIKPNSVSPYKLDIPVAQETLIREKLAARGIEPTRERIAKIWIDGGQQK